MKIFDIVEGWREQLDAYEADDGPEGLRQYAVYGCGYDLTRESARLLYLMVQAYECGKLGGTNGHDYLEMLITKTIEG